MKLGFAISGELGIAPADRALSYGREVQFVDRLPGLPRASTNQSGGPSAPIPREQQTRVPPVMLMPRPEPALLESISEPTLLERVALQEADVGELIQQEPGGEPKCYNGRSRCDRRRPSHFVELGYGAIG